MLKKVLLTALLAATVAYCQRGGGRRGGTEGADGGEMAMRTSQPTKPQLLADKLKLDKQQRQELQTILLAAGEDAAPLRTQIGNARVQLASALIEGKSDDVVKQAQENYAALAAQMTGVESKAFVKIYAMLKPNQQSRAAQGFELMAGIFQQGGRGPGGSGRGERGERGERGR